MIGRTTPRRLLGAGLAVLVAGVGVLVSDPGGAAYPGPNGELLFGGNVNGSSGYVARGLDDPSFRLVAQSDSIFLSEVSPDGTLLATGGTNPRRLSILRMADGVEVQSFLGGYGWPSWSPDGTKVVAHRRDGPFDPQRTDVLDLSAGTATTLHEGGSSFPDLHWSPLGDRILASAGTSLFVFAPTGGPVTALHTAPQGRTVTAADWAPDGSAIVYEEQQPLEGSASVTTLRVIDVDGTDDRMLLPPVPTGSDAVQGDLNPQWSPDGTRIAFQRTVPEGGTELHTVAPDGSGLQHHPGFDGVLLDWSSSERPSSPPSSASTSTSSTTVPSSTSPSTTIPDPGGPSSGRLLLSDPAGVVSVATDLGDRRTIPLGGRIWEAQVSPDGQWLAFTVGDADPEVRVARLDGSEVRTVATGVRHPSWHPSGDRLVVTQADGRGLVDVLVATGARADLPGTGDMWEGRWSPDGSRLAAIEGSCATTTPRLVLIGGGGTRVLASEQDGCDTSGFSRLADWSPDGSRLLYEWGGNACTSHVRSVEIDDDSSTDRAITEPSTADATCGEFGAAWSPDGSSIAYGADTGPEPGGLFLADPVSGTRTRLSSEDGGHPGVLDWYAPATAPPPPSSGAKIAYADAGQIWVLDEHGARAVTSYGPFSQGLWPAWSPDGTELAWLEVNGTIQDVVVAKADGSDKRTVFPGNRGVSPPVWSPDGSLIAGSDRHLVDGPALPQIFLAPSDGFQGMDAITVVSTPGPATSPSFSPDGQRLVFETIDPDSGQLDPRDARVLATVRLDGSDHRLLRPDGSPRPEPQYPAWSPAGDEVVYQFASLSSGCAQHLRLLDLGDVTTRELAAPVDGTCNTSPARWNDDGSALAFTYCTFGDTCHLAVVDRAPAATPVTLRTLDPGAAGGPLDSAPDWWGVAVPGDDVTPPTTVPPPTTSPQPPPPTLPQAPLQPQPPTTPSTAGLPTVEVPLGGTDGATDPGGAASSPTVSVAAGSPSLATDRAVAPPGGTVELTGAGFAPGSQVAVRLEPVSVLAPTTTAPPSTAAPSTTRVPTTTQASATTVSADEVVSGVSVGEVAIFRAVEARHMGSVAAGGDGTFRTLVRLPDDLLPGRWDLVASGIGPDGTLREVRAPLQVAHGAPALPRTGVETTDLTRLGLAGIACGVLLLACGLLLSHEDELARHLRSLRADHRDR